PGAPRWVRSSLLGLAIAGAGALLATWIALAWLGRHRLPSLAAAVAPAGLDPGPPAGADGGGARVRRGLEFLAGIEAFRRPRAFALLLLVSVAAWIVDAILVLLIAHALHLP